MPDNQSIGELVRGKPHARRHGAGRRMKIVCTVILEERSDEESGGEGLSNSVFYDIMANKSTPP